MKISKILCGALLGCVVGSAFGVPTPEDRKKFCDQHPDKFVWVEKTKACIPINPCRADDPSISSSYCVEGPGHASEMVYDRYIENVLGGIGVVERATLPESDPNRDMFTSYKFVDGGYLVFGSHWWDFLKEDYGALIEIEAGCFVYGKKYRIFNMDAKQGLCEGVDSETQCTDIADFVMLVRGTFCRGMFSSDNSCVINCEKVDESDKKSGPGGGNL